LFPSVDQRTAWARQRPYLASFVVGSYMALVSWVALWVVGFHVQGKDFALLLVLGLFVGGPVLVLRARQRIANDGTPASVGFRSLPASPRGPGSVFFCLLPLITFGVMSPMCLGYAAVLLHSRRLRVLTWLSWALLLASFGFGNHSHQGSAIEAAGIWIGLLNAVGGTALCFQCRRQLANSD